MTHRPTIKDVAQRAKVSLSTVSLVVNNKGYVSPETREKVERVIQELGYHPTSSARGLALRKSGNIGFMLTHDHFTQYEPFYTKIFLGAEFEIQKHNYYILLATIPKQFNPSNATPRFLLEKNVDGVIIAGHVDNKLVEYIESMGFPLVLIDYKIPNRQYSTILMNNYKGAEQSVKHLLSIGHNKIGFIGGDIKHPSIKQRFMGYAETLYTAGIQYENDWVVKDEPDTKERNGFDAARKLLQKNKNKPTALFVANDAMALGVMDYCKKNNLSIPDELAIIGFDNIEASYHVNPKLTTVDVNKEEMGKIGVQTLLNSIKEGNGIVRNIHTSVELIIRESCGSNNRK